MATGKPRIGFIGIGAQKCASTWLHDVLVDHPELALPGQVKEVDYFTYHYDRGRQWYERRFDSVSADLLCGEISPSYLHNPGVAERVFDYNPAMRIILIARDPVARAISNHKHELRIGNIHGSDQSFEFGLDNNAAYVEQGLYGKHLGNWLARFPAEQILVLKFDDVVVRPARSLAKVCEFLGVDAGYNSPQLEKQSNASYLNRSPAAARAKNLVRGAVRAVGLGSLWQKLGDTGLRDKYRKVNRVKPEDVIGAPKPETLEKLKAIFQPDLEKFESISGLSTANWLKQ